MWPQQYCHALKLWLLELATRGEIIVATKIRKNSAGLTFGPRDRVNLIEGANVSLAVADDPGDDEIDVTISGADPGAPATADFVLVVANVALPGARVIGVDSSLLAIDTGVGGTFTLGWPGFSARKNSGAYNPVRRRMNFLEGANVTLTVADDGPGDEIDVTIAAAGGYAPAGALYLTLGLDPSLTNERQLSHGTQISFIDTGPNGTLIVNWDGLLVRKNSGLDISSRQRINFIEGSNVTITVTDDPPDLECDVTITAAGNYAPPGASYLTLANDATLTSERVLTAGTTITLTDTGPGGTLTVSGSGPSVRVNSGGSVFTRRRLNFIGNLTIADDPGNDEVDLDLGTVPAGAVLMWTATSMPSGWLECDGAAVSRTTYAALFAVIGTTFGAGDGASTFNLPNAKSRFVRGLNGADAACNELGETGGADSVTLTSNELPAHSHSPQSGFTSFWCRDVTTPTATLTGVATNARAAAATASSGLGAAFSVLNAFLTLKFIIKT